MKDKSSPAGVSATAATEGRCSDSSDLPVVQVPREGVWGRKDSVTLRALTEKYGKVLKEILS